MSGDDSKKVVEFPKAIVEVPKAEAKAEVPSEEEWARRLKAGVERLARLKGEWLFWVEGDAKKLDVQPAALKAMVRRPSKRTRKRSATRD